MIPEHRSKQARQPHQMSKMEQVLLVGINLDHMLEHHQHLSIPVKGTEISHFFLSTLSLQAKEIMHKLFQSFILHPTIYL